jgi:ethanolamine ammonia-lyase small subunit
MSGTTPPDPWAALSRLTPARIALGRAGGSLPTSAHLAFQLAHAQARDAVHHAADIAAVAALLEAEGLRTLSVASDAPDRATYLQRPDLGRRLAASAHEALADAAGGGEADLAIVIADGLSGFAMERHAAPLALLLHRRLAALGWRIAPVVLVRGGRVAVGDEIGALLGARLVVLLIGERPGLSSPDSLGAYLTFAPRPGRTDAERNCVSNIRPEGLPVPAASERILWLLTEARRRQLTGVGLKEEAGRLAEGDRARPGLA